ncbi:CDC27 protein, partial [Coemansia sp. RSA 2559]
MSTANEVLDLLVLHDSQVVTYRRLSRELNVHVNTAKQLLSDFHTNNRDKCHATYLVTGTKHSLPGSMAEIQVTLVPEAKLLDTQGELANAAYHVYSLESRRLDDSESYVMANAQAGNNRDMATLCPVRSSVARVAKAAGRSIDDTSSSSALMVPKVATAPEIDVKPDTSTSSEEDVAEKEARAPAKSKPTPTAPRSAKSFFGRVKTVKKEPSQKKSKKEQSEESQQSKGTQDEESQMSMETQNEESQMSEHRDKEIEQSDADFEMQSVEGNDNDEALQLVENMFDDEDAPAKEETASNKPSDSGVASPAKQAKLDSDVEMMDDSDNNMDSQESAVAETKAARSDDDSNAAQNSGRRRVRKRRKVSKVKHTKNKRGMLVSQV